MFVIFRPFWKAENDAWMKLGCIGFTSKYISILLGFTYILALFSFFQPQTAMDHTQGKMSGLGIHTRSGAVSVPPGNQRVENLADDSKLSVNTSHSNPGSGPASPKIGSPHRSRGLNLLDEVVRVNFAVVIVCYMSFACKFRYCQRLYQ